MVRRENNPAAPTRRKRPPEKGASPRVLSSSRRPSRVSGVEPRDGRASGLKERNPELRAERTRVREGRNTESRRERERLAFVDKTSDEPQVPAAIVGDYSRGNAAERLKSKRRSDVKAHDNKVIFIGASIFVGIILVVSLVMSWNMWWRYDDAADIQGTWTVQGSNNTVKITDSALYLTDTLFYDYTLDTENKRITFTFEDKKGEGVYSFSDDRNTLTIAEENTSTSDDTDPSIYTTLVRSSDNDS